MATKEEVRQRVGEDLGIVPVGQDLESQDQLRIDATYNEAYQILEERGLVSWAVAGTIPDKLVPSFSLLMQFMLLVSYSVPDSRYVRIISQAGEDGEKAIAKIAKLTTQEYISNEDEQDY